MVFCHHHSEYRLLLISLYRAGQRTAIFVATWRSTTTHHGLPVLVCKLRYVVLVLEKITMRRSQTVVVSILLWKLTMCVSASLGPQLAECIPPTLKMCLLHARVSRCIASLAASLVLQHQLSQLTARTNDEHFSHSGGLDVRAADAAGAISAFWTGPVGAPNAAALEAAQVTAAGALS